MSKKQICPWCMTEIVWDEEIGPEEFCPNCFNELGEFRTVHVRLDPPDRDAADEAEDTGNADAPEAKMGEVIKFPAARMEASAGAKKALVDWDDLTVKEMGVVRFEEAMQAIIDSQPEAPECPHCRELMFHAGMRKVADSEFAPQTPAGLDKPLLRAPFALVMFVCPNCFYTSFFLAKADQKKVVDSFDSNIE